VQSDRTKLPQKGDREKNILMSLAFLKERMNKGNHFVRRIRIKIEHRLLGDCVVNRQGLRLGDNLRSHRRTIGQVLGVDGKTVKKEYGQDG